MKNFLRLVTPSVLALTLISILMISCHQNKESGIKTAELQTPAMDKTVPPPPPPSNGNEKAALDQTELHSPLLKDERRKEGSTEPQAPVIDRKVIKTGDIRFKTSDLAQTRQTIVNAANTLNGYVSEESQSGYDKTSEVHLSVRVPAQNFDTLLSVISSNAEYFDSKNIHTQDVTEEYIDVAARLKTKKELENQYTTLLKKAQSIKEIMEVERELNNVRSEIESAEGRLRYLSSQVAFSTLNLTFYKSSSNLSGSPQGFWSRLGDGFLSGWQLLLNLIVGLASTWSLFLMGGVGFILFRRFRKRNNSND
ncbi:MAG: DUF4349 domain-containing protein [Saprospiraceae bacterium]|nr:DUF4349 domain-containing protein [Saprospiraceae bacterium]